MNTGTDEAKKAYNAYMREYRAKHKDSIKANNARYWARKAAKKKEAEATAAKEPTA